MPTCCEPTCRNKENSQFIACAAPFCKKQFHLACAGLKGKPKEEISKLYFVCLSCDDFIRYSNSKIDLRLNRIEEDLNETIVSLKQNIKLLEEKTDGIKDRLDTYEKSLLNCEQTNKIIKKEYECSIKAVAERQKNIEESVTNLEKSVAVLQSQTSEIKPTPITEIKQVSTDNRSKYQIRVNGIKEAPKSLKFLERQEFERGCFSEILEHLNENNINFTDCFRLGKLREDSKKPRTLLVTLTSIWDKRKILSKGNLLSNYKNAVFISPALSLTELKTEKQVLKKRWQLIQEGTERKHIKIRNLKLFVKNEDDEEIEIKCD